MGHFFLSGVTSCVSQDKKKKRERKGKRKVQRYGDNTKTKNGQLRSTRHMDARRFRGGKHGHRKKRKCRKGLGNNFSSFSLSILFSLPFPPVSLSRRATHQNTCHRGQQTKWHKITLVIGANSGSSHARLDGMLIKKNICFVQPRTLLTDSR